jgi:alanine racemase
MMESSSNNTNNNGSINDGGGSTATSGTRRPPAPPVRDVLLGRSIVSSTHNDGRGPAVADTDRHRAVHRIRLSALAHNYAEVESAANRQRCSVIVVVKADGYGHGALPTALFLADEAGADSFAVATLEEAIALRRAFQGTAAAAQQPGGVNLNRFGAATLKNPAGSGPGGGGDDLSTTAAWSTVGGGGSYASSNGPTGVSSGGRRRRKSLRPAHIRILVLGPPVGFPRCFDDYYHHNIEVMISGPEVARALLEWVCNKDERKRTLVERVATESKERILSEQPHHGNQHGTTTTTAGPGGSGPGVGIPPSLLRGAKPKRTDLLELQDGKRGDSAWDGTSDTGAGPSGSDAVSLASSRSGSTPPQQQQQQPKPQYHPPSATLGNVTGMDLAKEVREILKNQKLLADSQQIFLHQQPPQKPPQMVGGTHSRKASGSLPPISALTFTPVSSNHDLVKTADTTVDSNATAAGPTTASTGTTTTVSSNSSPAISSAVPTGPIQVFAGIEEAAKYSRTRHKAIASEVFYDPGDDDAGDDNGMDDDDDNGTADADNYNDSENDASLCGQGINTQGGGHTTDGGDIPVAGATLVDPAKGAGRKTNQSTLIPKSRDSKSRMNNIPTNTNRTAKILMVPARKRLRWHAEVESGMGRSGFQTDPLTKEEMGRRRDPVDIIKELVDLEVKMDCPVEFYGMCTHMADAHSNSTYTHEQIGKFKGLLRRVRDAGVSVPTISTDNSAALLTTSLTHFDARELLTQADADSRGYVRTGGGIYGQRPAFKQLQAVSTLMASVRHVAVLRGGESVGYDRAYVAPTDVRIATLAIGFADGYPRELGNGVGRVSIRGHLFPVAGNVCMDMLMVELGPASGEGDGVGAQIVVGDTAILWGPDPEGGDEEGEGHVRLQDLAAILKTTQSALTCGLNKERVLRQYV